MDNSDSRRLQSCLPKSRNYLQDKDPMIAQSVDGEILDGEILNVIDRSTRARVPRLRLNLDDNEYFRARLTNEKPIPFSHLSHRMTALIKPSVKRASK